MQGKRESPKISVIEINSCELRPTKVRPIKRCKVIAQVCAFRTRLGGAFGRDDSEMISANFDVSPIIVVFPYPSVDCSHT